jgi:molybdate transport system regulatory protein
MEVKVRFWLEKDCKPIIGKGGYEILKAIERFGSIAKASEALGMSYKFVWQYLKRIEKNLGVPVVEMIKGGKNKGGTRLTQAGKELIRQYEIIESLINMALMGLGGVKVIACHEYAIELPETQKMIERYEMITLTGCI